jgi:hypothetical protein
VIGQQHGLTKLTETLATLEAGQRKQETRDTTIQTQLTTQAAALTTMAQTLRRLWGCLVGLAVLTVAMLGLLGWQLWHPPQLEYVRALGAVDTTLMQHWITLPKGSQEALADTYRRMGLLPPSQRK